MTPVLQGAPAPEAGLSVGLDTLAVADRGGTTMTEMIRARGLVKRYKEVVALGGLDLSVEEGTVLALLGPNGAGKTTAVRCLATLLIPDEGEASIDGVDVLADPQAVRRRIGLSGQYAAVDEQLTGVENLTMVGRLYGLGKARSRARAHELLERFDLADAGDRPAPSPTSTCISFPAGTTTTWEVDACSGV